MSSDNNNVLALRQEVHHVRVERDEAEARAQRAVEERQQLETQLMQIRTRRSQAEEKARLAASQVEALRQEIVNLKRRHEEDSHAMEVERANMALERNRWRDVINSLSNNVTASVRELTITALQRLDKPKHDFNTPPFRGRRTPRSRGQSPDVGDKRSRPPGA